MDKQDFSPFMVKNDWYSEYWLKERQRKTSHPTVLKAYTRPALIGLAAAVLSRGAAIKYLGLPF